MYEMVHPFFSFQYKTSSKYVTSVNKNELYKRTKILQNLNENIVLATVRFEIGHYTPDVSNVCRHIR